MPISRCASPVFCEHQLSLLLSTAHTSLAAQWWASTGDRSREVRSISAPLCTSQMRQYPSNPYEIIENTPFLIPMKNKVRAPYRKLEQPTGAYQKHIHIHTEGYKNIEEPITTNMKPYIERYTTKTLQNNISIYTRIQSYEHIETHINTCIHRSMCSCVHHSRSRKHRSISLN